MSPWALPPRLIGPARHILARRGARWRNVEERFAGWPSDAYPGANVLLVEDEPDIARLIERLFSREATTIQTADTLSQAERMLDRGTPDLIILDRMLPDGDGAAFCAKIRSNPRTQRVPVLFVTVRATTDDRIQALISGADDYLAKPFDPRELVVRADNLIRRGAQSLTASRR